MNPLAPASRRRFLQTGSLALGAALAARFTPSALAQPSGSNGDIRVGIIGLNNKGAAHVRHLLKTPGARLVALCDVDPAVLAREVAKLDQAGHQVFATTESRLLLERPDIDAVVIATGNHWHALLTVWACQAGKDVYVEKPASRTVWEGRQMIAAATRYGRIVQTGTQFRSDTGLPAIIEWIQAGHLGPIRLVHAMCYKLRESIGRRAPWYPTDLDYNTFCGPTPMVPLTRDRLHYDWHWSWLTGNAELGNNGVHTLDIARRFAGHDGPPARALSLGGRFVHDDAADTPNVQLALFDYPGRPPLYFESRGLPAKPGANYMDAYCSIRDGVVVHCEGGYFSGYTGGAAYDLAGKVIRKFEGDGGAGHMANFLAAVRSRRTTDLAAPITTGHASTTLCHYGNISYHLGRPAPLDSLPSALPGFNHALETVERIRLHLAVHGVDLASQPLTLGPWINLDGPTDGIAAVDSPDPALLDRARAFLRQPQRPPFIIPDTV